MANTAYGSGYNSAADPYRVDNPRAGYNTSSRGSLRAKKQKYQSIFDDMVSDPVKYYDAFDQNVSKYKAEMARNEYMSILADADLPDELTYNAQVYDDMMSDPTKYMNQLGQRGYYDELDRYKELYGLEKTRNTEVISTIKDRVSVDFLKEAGLDSAYKYTDSDEDQLLMALGYAPSSFKYKQSDLEEKVLMGKQAADYFKADENGELDTDSMFLSTYYQYDEADPEDVLNRALGLMPKSFKYGSSDEEKDRERNGLLPIEADTYVKTSKQYATELAEYEAKMQDYVDKKAEYDALPWLTKLFTPAPVNPYPNDSALPTTLFQLKEYKYNRDATAEEAADPANIDIFAKTPETEKKPNMYWNEDDPLSLEDFTVSDLVAKKAAERTKAMSAIYADVKTPEQLLTATFKDAMATPAPDNADLLRNFRAVDKQVSENARKNSAVSDALSAGYSPENLDAVLNSDLITRLDISGGADEVKRFTVDALRFSSDSDGRSFNTALAAKLSLVPDSDMLPENMSNIFFSMDNEIYNIKTQLDALGWRGEKQSDNADIQGLLDQATYRVLQMRDETVSAYRQSLEGMPSWLVSITTGGVKGVENWEDSITTVALELAKLNYSNPDLKSAIGTIAEDVAVRGQAQDVINVANTGRGAGASDFTTNTLYNSTASAVEMGLNMAISSGFGGGASAASKELTGAAKVWAKLGKIAAVKPQSAGFFASSLGHNLMQGTLEGRTDSEKWLAAVPSAYIETAIEQSFGFFSGKASPISALVRNGAKNVTARTLGNVGKALLENTVGEAVEENLQDLTNTFFRDLFYEGYDPAVVGSDGYFDWDRIGETTKSTMLIGVALSVFGMGGMVGDVRSAANAEISFNKAVEAYEAGDMTTFNMEMKKMGASFSRAVASLEESYKDGKLDKLLQGMSPDDATANALNNMQTAVENAANLRAAKDGGAPISDDMINEADARANAAINEIQTGIRGQELNFNTLYDQIANSPELVSILNKRGYASRLIKSATGPLTVEQASILRNLDIMESENPYISVEYAEGQTVDGFNFVYQKANQKYMEADTELKRMVQQSMNMINAAYSNGKKSGVTEYEQQKAELISMYKRVKAIKQKSEESALKRDALYMQNVFGAAFRGEQPQMDSTLDIDERMNDFKLMYLNGAVPGISKRLGDFIGRYLGASETTQTPPDAPTAPQTAQTMEQSTAPAERHADTARSSGESLQPAADTAESPYYDDEAALTRMDIAEQRVKIDNMKKEGKIKISDKGMTLNEVATALENHALYLEWLAADAKETKKPSISVDGLLPSEIEAIGKAVVDRRTAINDLRGIAKQLRARADDQVKTVQNKIRKTLDKYREDKKITPKFKAVIDKFNRMLDTKDMGDQTRADLLAVEEYVKKAYEDEGLEIPMNIERALSRLNKMNVADLSVQDLDAINTTLLAAKKQDLEDRKEAKTVWGKKYVALLEKINDEVNAIKKLRFEKTAFMSSPRTAALSFGKEFQDNLINNVLRGSIVHGENEMWVQENVYKRWNELGLNKEFGTDKMANKKQTKVHDNILDEDLTRSDLLSIYANAKDADGFDALVKNGYDPVKIQKFVQGFEQNYADLYEAYGLMRKLFDFYEPQNNATSRHKTGADMITELDKQQNPEYYPQVKTDYYFQVAEMNKQIGVNPSFSIARTGGGEIMLANPAWVIQNYHRQANQYNSYAAAIHDSNRLLNSDVVKNALKKTRIDNKTGESAAQQYFRDFLFRMANGKGQMNEADSFMAKARSNVAGAKLSLSPSIAVKQLGAYMGGVMHIDMKHLINPKAWGKALKTIVSKTERMKFYKQNPDMYERIEEGFLSIETGSLEKARGKAKLIRMTDALTVIATYHAAELQAKAEARKNSRLDVEARASELFHNVLWDTQQMYGTGFNAPVQQSEAAKWFLMFMTQQMQQKNMLRQSWKMWQQGNKAGAARGVAGVVLNNVVYAAIVAGVGKLFKIYPFDDDEGTEKETLEQFLQAMSSSVFPIISRVGGGAADVVAKAFGTDIQFTDTHGLQSPVLESIFDVMEGIEGTADEGTSAYGKIVDLAKPALELFLGIPATNAEKWTVKAAEALFPDFDYEKWKVSQSAMEDYKPDNPTEPKRYYADLKNAITSGNDKKASELIGIIKENGGKVDSFINAKTGGETLSIEDKYKVKVMW